MCGELMGVEPELQRVEEGSMDIPSLVVWAGAIQRREIDADSTPNLLRKIAGAVRVMHAEWAESIDSKMDLIDKMERDQSQNFALRRLLFDLCAAEASYRSAHDRYGDGHIKTGRAWDLMRRASLAAAEALNDLEVPGAVGDARQQEEKTMHKRPVFKDLTNRFTYHAPRGDQADRYRLIRSSALEFSETLVGLAPESRELDLAVQKVEEAVFWANAAIARSGDAASEGGPRDCPCKPCGSAASGDAASDNVEPADDSDRAQRAAPADIPA